MRLLEGSWDLGSTHLGYTGLVTLLLIGVAYISPVREMKSKVSGPAKYLITPTSFTICSIQLPEQKQVASNFTSPNTALNSEPLQKQGGSMMRNILQADSYPVMGEVKQP